MISIGWSMASRLSYFMRHGGTAAATVFIDADEHRWFHRWQISSFNGIDCHIDPVLKHSEEDAYHPALELPVDDPSILRSLRDGDYSRICNSA